MESVNGVLNFEILYLLEQGALEKNLHLYEPKALDIDLKNLYMEGMITSTDLNEIQITDLGRRNLGIVMALAEYDSKTREDIEREFFENNKIDSLDE